MPVAFLPRGLYSIIDREQKPKNSVFFTDMAKVDKEKRLVTSVIKVKEKFGKNAIFKGIDLTEQATQRERNETVGGHRGGES